MRLDDIETDQVFVITALAALIFVAFVELISNLQANVVACYWLL